MYGGQRHVAVEHQGLCGTAQLRNGLCHGVAGTQLLRLFGPGDVIGLQGGADDFAAVAVDDDQFFGVKTAGRVDHMLGQRLAGDRMQDFGEIGMHALALAGSENDDVHG